MEHLKVGEYFKLKTSRFEFWVGLLIKFKSTQWKRCKGEGLPNEQHLDTIWSDVRQEHVDVAVWVIHVLVSAWYEAPVVARSLTEHVGPLFLPVECQHAALE